MFKKKERDSSLDLDIIKGVAECTPVISWVNQLLMYMHKNSIDDFTLMKSEEIPPGPLEDDDLPEGEITFDQIINRLKILVGLDPISYTEAKEGHHELFIHGIRYLVKILFDDSSDDPTYQINISVSP